jgi:hypothetical protein
MLRASVGGWAAGPIGAARNVGANPGGSGGHPTTHPAPPPRPPLRGTRFRASKKSDTNRQTGTFPVPSPRAPSVLFRMAKQRGRIERTVTLAALCLAGGATMTVLVAWACTLSSTVHTSPVVLCPYDGQDITWAERYGTASVAEVSAWRRLGVMHAVTAMSSGFGVRDEHLRLHWAFGDGMKLHDTARVHSAGWPLVACRCIQAADRQAMTWRGAFEVPDWLKRDQYGAQSVVSRPPLPLRPIPLGFTLNTFFYSAILGALFAAPRVVRPVYRRRRGLCPGCAYSSPASRPARRAGVRKGAGRLTVAARRILARSVLCPRTRLRSPPSGSRGSFQRCHFTPHLSTASRSATGLTPPSSLLVTRDDRAGWTQIDAIAGGLRSHSGVAYPESVDPWPRLSSAQPWSRGVGVGAPQPKTCISVRRARINGWPWPALGAPWNQRTTPRRDSGTTNRSPGGAFTGVEGLPSCGPRRRSPCHFPVPPVLAWLPRGHRALLHILGVDPGPV